MIPNVRVPVQYSGNFSCDNRGRGRLANFWPWLPAGLRHVVFHDLAISELEKSVVLFINILTFSENLLILGGNIP